MTTSYFPHSLISLLTFFFLASCQGESQLKAQNEKLSSKAEQIENLIGLYSDYGGFNGSVLVAHEGKILYKGGYGKANMEWDIPNELDTKFQIASVSKQFTAMLVMQLVSEGKLDLHEPISTYLPDYPTEKGDQINIHQLLTHSSGVPNAQGKDKAFLPKDMVNQFANDKLEFSPGEKFGYSNSGYVLLGYLMETLTEKSYEELLKERIFEPLGMENSGFYRHRAIINKMSSGYVKGFGDFFDMDNTDESSAYSAGGIYATVEDLYVWDQALYTEKLLPQAYKDQLFTKHIADPGYGGHYGYGWELIDRKVGDSDSLIETISHGGRIGGYLASIRRMPSSRSSIILLSNTNYAFLNSISKAITGILYDKPYSLPLKPLALFMNEVIEKEGIDKGISYYKEHKDSDEYYVSEQELIIAGYKKLHAGNAEDAAKIFKLSIQVFPDRDNPYDSYAEALMELGEREESIKFYKKSLEINPNNQNAVRMIEKLERDEP
ncbi:MAG: serine hydrolase [Bacteroidia bacterium]|nr:serine hydrolase [Bacteroidia bacterium]